MLIVQALILLIGVYFANAGYGVTGQPGSQYGGYSDSYGNSQSDVEAPAYVPAYLRNQQFSKSTYPRRYSGAKTYSGTITYSGTKTAHSGTKSAYSGTKTAYSGTKTHYGQPSRYSDSSKTWHSDSGEVNYSEFSNNANKQYAPICDIECKNNGICVDRNTCFCPANYYGLHCEFEKKPCLTYPPLPMNSRRQCSSEMCTISCMEGHKFIDGSSVANIKCVNGEWKPTRADLTSLPDCDPECAPPCLNGGICLGVNTCQCPADYRGPQCQYASNVCDARKLAFNGGYSCFGDAEKFSCRLACPAGSSYSTPPADIYTCLYSTGMFQPQPIPHCVFNDVIIMTPHYNHSSSPHSPRSYSQMHSEPTSGKPSVDHSTAHSVQNFDKSTGRWKYGSSEKSVHVIVQDYTPKGGTCLTWAGVHYKTFDGQIYSFQSPCQHILVRESKEHKYMVAVKQGKCKTPTYCPTELTIYLEDKPYILSIGEEGSVVFRNTKRLIPIPATLPGIRVSMPSDYVIVNLDGMGVTIKWDTNNLVAVEGSVLLWNNTEGLCGNLNRNPDDDFTTKEGTIAKTKTVLASSWQIKKIEDVCESSPTETSACASKSDDDMKKALQFCTKVFSQSKFRKCSMIMDVSLLLEACQWDYCACTTAKSPEECACSTVSVYAKECLRHGVEELKNWRDAETCPMKCPEGKLYQSCGPDAQPSCLFPSLPSKPDNATCVEGCFCPEGLLMEGGLCVPKSECPCRLRNKSFKPGSVIPKDCNTCTCDSGQWHCTQVPCGARCGAVGDPHYTTFDGLRYDFMGHCTYTLLRTDDLNIEVENVACSGTISEEMNLTPSKGEGKPSCTKAVTLNTTGVSLHLRQGGLIFVDGTEIKDLPVMVGNIKIRAASSLFLIVQMPNRVDLWWDGNTRVFVDVPPEFHDKTKGLCGTFNLNQKDDFLTPENDIEQSAHAFANKWKTREFCSDIDVKEPEHPCKANVENKETAENYCSKLKSKLFESCHWYVDVEPYYEECLYDMCACAGDLSRCLCPILGDYAMSCAKAGVMVQWRYNVKECELSCSGGQEYTVCADSCLRKCSDTSLEAINNCKPTCVEGCACPAGQLLDDSGVCVPVGLCPCYSKLGSQTTVKFNAGYKEVRPGRRERELCECVGARWECLPATPEDIQNYPPAEELRANCSTTNNMEFTTCQIAEPLTCKNMHLPPTSTSLECRPGCQCKKGYVMDMVAKKCILPSECPCHHGGRSYPDGYVMQEECNECKCKSGSWDCTTRQCAGICGAWGDSHVTTFDGADYDFEGVCTYLLAKGVMDSKDGFDVDIQNVPCGTTGATCSKSVTLKVGGGGNEEIVSLTKDAPIPDISKLKRIKLRMAGTYVFLDVPSLGMSLQWDRGVRVYVKVRSMWQGRLKGLCGNYNNDMRDDFQTPSGGGMVESSSLIFADSWKLKPTCPKPTDVEDHCKQRPQRKEWAINACGAMKQYPFTLCHTEVSPTAFVERCERDACACDSGDDCECACTALAAYAYACAHRGVTFKWRTQERCPMQCDEECSNYNECVSACPLETCDNTLYFSEIKTTCEAETCVEGCKPKKSCPEGEVYKNISSTECIPRAKCRPVCMTLRNGTEILEGEVIEEDACHTCRCSKKTKVCSGQPCSTEQPRIGSSETPATEKPHDEQLKCVTGWTNWLSRTAAEIGPNGESIENEPLPEPKDLKIGSPMCEADMMTEIECRTVKDHKTAKETGLNVECSLERGLVCKEVGKTCPDFEIRVNCECGACANSVRPSEPHPTDCTKFYECVPGAPVLKDCGPGTMYNPQSMVCDWPATVLALRPECLVSNATTTRRVLVFDETTIREKITEAEESTAATPNVLRTESGCPPGQVFIECMYPCDKTCNNFKAKLMASGKCTRRDDCLGGCIDGEVANIKCNYGSLWRDEKTCVPLKDCTCEFEGSPVKPGGVVVNGCVKCQCLDNEMHCDSSECVSIISPHQGSTHEAYIFPTPIPEAITVTTTTETPTTVTSTTITLTTVTLATPPEKHGRIPFTTTAQTTVQPTTLIIKSTVSPPPECSPDSYIDLMFGDQPVPETAFTSSSYAGEEYAPQFSKYNGRPIAASGGSWKPAVADLNQYIQVELPRREPIYGVKLIGNPLYDQYVTSYELLHSDDGVTFSTVDGPDGKPKVFRGPIDHNQPTKQMIEPPIEAKFVRLHPLSWHEGIAVQWELIGCQEPVTTVTDRTKTPTLGPEDCTEPLGLAAEIPLENIQVSSNDKLKKYLSLTGDKAWKPLYNSPGEWVMFDFTSPRNITGVRTRGGPNGWVTVYKIYYTSDLNIFNPVVDETGAEKFFAGNFDKDTDVLNEFKPPIHARYLKIMPIKSKDNIEIRVEPIGCYEPYPVTETTVMEPSTETSTAFACQICPGVQIAACDCTAEAPYFDGENCVTMDQCPCMEGFMSYSVGSQFLSADCKECVCKLGGTVSCSLIKNCECAPNLVPKMTDTCDCTCTPCPSGTKICPTSKLCLPLEKWCDGLQDCPDDEKDCATTTLTTVTEPLVITTVAPTVAATQPTTTSTTLAPTTTTAKPEECPKVECPPGYIIQYTTTTPSSYSRYSSDLPPPRPRVSYQRYYRGGYSKGGRGGFSKGGYTKTGRPGFSKGGYNPYTPPPQNQGFTLDKPSLNNTSVNNTKQECRQFKCIPKLPPFKPGFTPAPVLCSVVTCPLGYTLKLEKVPTGVNQCPLYECVPPPERPVYCNVTGRTFNTFDGTEYKYDVCYHLLARENRFDSWAILLRKASYNSKNELLLYQDDQRILVKPNMMIEYDNYEYTVEQTNKICFQKNSFDVNRLGNGIAIKSRKYNFTVLYTADGDVKIGVFKNYLGTVDGMCGAYDGNPHNDRSLPDGRLAKSIDEFGRAWAKPGVPRDACEAKVIPPVQQKKCWDMCDVITKEPFSQCGTVLNLDKWRHICLEKVCECAESKNNATKMTEEQCRCQLLESLVAECLAADKNIDIASWRMLMDCQADCPPPLVHYDCYGRRCEPTCSSVGAFSSCPLEDGQCFPGCYCPEGKLRKGDKCVVPADCLDCTCTGVGTPAKYTTFEGDDLPFLANCTYLASRDRNETNQHKYEVYATNGPCEDSDVVCTKAVHLIYEKNVLHITKDPNTKKLITTIGDTAIYKYPAKMAWGTISLTNGQDITVVVPDIHVELTVIQSKMEFHVNVPSFLYGNQTEGLCGVCAGYQNVLITSNGTITEDIDEYGESWEASPEALKTLNLETEQCEQPPPPETCVTPPPEANPCYNLYNADRFGACIALVDPEPFVESCEADLCLNATDSCVAMERYAAACRAQGICLNDWRIDLCPYPCEEPFVYHACVDCERTCDNNEELEKNPKKCTNKPVEGCFCPEGKVRVNNTCIEPSKCFPCDAKKEHYAGDEWQEDACTKCECIKLTGEKGVQTSCTKEKCAMAVCSELEDLIEKPLAPGQCCPELMCVPKPVKNCTEPKKMECGYGQVLKQKTTPNGCTEFACECKPASECPSLPEQDDVEILEPGMERLVDDSGCCPRLQFLCKVDTCPQPPECPKFNTPKIENVTGKCCPVHKCEPPKDKCIVTLEWEAAAKGGEKARTKPQTVLKDLDAVWADGPCRSCRCESSPLGPVPSCTATQCPAIVSTDQFVVEPHSLPFYCCPVAVQVACRDGDNIYKVGENWTSTDNVCEKYRCEEVHEGKLERVKTVEHCEEKCIPGWEYFPAEEGSGKCCGKCVQVACLVNGQEKPVGAKWQSDDFCTNYTCVDFNGTLQVQSSNETCPKTPESVSKQFVVMEAPVKGQCCPKVDIVACIYNGKVYPEGETWSSPDPCKKLTCTRDASGTLVQKESTENCVKECKRGWKYEEPPKDVCCGHCVQESCVIGDELKTPGTTWMSADNCTTFSCEQLGDEVFVTSSKEMCPDVSACAPENIINDTCCQICKITSDNLSKCVPASIPSSQTVGIIRVRNAHHGLCVNQQPVKGFKECRGTCDSGTLFNNATGSHDSNCECCQATQYSPVTVQVTCTDGTVQEHRVASPLACACLRCGEPAAPMWPTKNVYSGTKTPQRPSYPKEREEMIIPNVYQRFGGETEKPRL